MRRKLSRVEQVFWAGNPTPAMNFCLVARLAGALEEAELAGAARCLPQRYPAAFARVTRDETGQAWLDFEDVPELPLRVLDGCGEHDWQATAAEELSEPVDLFRGPAIRLVLLRGAGFSDIVLTAHHGVADGMSGVYLLNTLLRRLGEPDSTPPDPLPSPSMYTLIPAQARAHPRLRLQSLFNKAMLSFLRLSGQLRPGRPQSPQTAEGTPPWMRFRVLSAALTQAETTALLARCKQEGISAHPAVCAAWLSACAALGIGGARPARKVSSPVNLREKLTAPVGEAFGMYMSNLVNQVDCSPQRDFWEIGRDLSGALARAAAGEGLFAWPLMMETPGLVLPPAETARLKEVFSRMPVGYDFSISNLGRLNWPAHFGPYTLQAVYGPVVNTSIQEKTVGVVTFGGQMTMTFTFRDAVIAEAPARELLNLACRTQREAVVVVNGKR